MLEETKLAVYQSELKEFFRDDPLIQNIAAVMAVLLEPVDVDYIADLATNPDGETDANQIEVTPDQVSAFIELVKKIEQKSKLSLLDEQQLESSDDVITEVDPADSIIQKRKMGYRFSDDFRDYVEYKHPELCRVFHGIVAGKLMNQWEAFKNQKYDD